MSVNVLAAREEFEFTCACTEALWEIVGHDLDALDRSAPEAVPRLRALLSGMKHLYGERGQGSSQN